MTDSQSDDDHYFTDKRRLSEMNSSDTNLMWRGLQLSRAKLKAVGQTSGLLSGFAVVAIIELEINYDGFSKANEMNDNVPAYLIIPFVICSCILVAVHMIALMISTCILPNLEMYSSYRGPNILQSPHEKLRTYIEIAWICSTAIGILLFLVVVALACWIKFYRFPMVGIIATCILGPVIIIFVIFAAVFYNSLLGHKFHNTANMVNQLNFMVENLQETELKSVVIGDY